MPKPTAKTTKGVVKTEEAPKGKNKPNKKVVEDYDEDEEIENSENDEMEEEIEEEPVQSKKAQQKKTNGKAQKIEIEEEEDDDEDDEEPEEDEDDEEHVNVEIGNDDIYIPKKKVKTENGGVPVKGGEKGKAKNKIPEELNGAVNESYVKTKKGKAERLSKKVEEADIPQRGIVYVGHLPYGFVEEGIKEYFSQYGEILNLHLARSKKSARSMGYAFIEFKYKEVAKVAADSMNGYMFYGKKLVCRVLDDDEGVKVRTKKFRFIPNNKKFVQERNRSKDPKELKKEVKNLLKHEDKKREKLKELGITYEFPGFKQVIEKLQKTEKPAKISKDKQAQKPAQKGVQKVQEKPVEKPAQKAQQKQAEKPVQKVQEKAAPKVQEKPVDKSTKKNKK